MHTRQGALEKLRICKFTNLPLYLTVIMLVFSACQSNDAGTPTDQVAVIEETPVLQDYSSQIGGDFSLTDHDEKVFDLSQHRGDIFLVFFGYTYCPDACPTMLSKLTVVYDMLEVPSDQRVRTLYVSVDPERDTPAQLKEYLQYFSTIDVLGLTGSIPEVDQVVEQFGVQYQKVGADSAAEYLVNHSTWLFMVDQEGKIRYRFRHADTPEHIVSGIKQLL